MSNADPVEVQRLFKQRRRNQFLLLIPVLCGCVLMSALGGRPELLGIPHNAIVAVAGVLVFGAVVFSFVNWRCPACKRYLGRALLPSFCSGCGAKFC